MVPKIGPETNSRAVSLGGSALDRRYANFDAIRLIAASTVLISHAFELADGTESTDPLVKLLGSNEILGVYGVYVFFIVSGFLITRSFTRRRTVIGYLTRRVLRIYPALIVSVLACAFVLGPALTSWSLGGYLTDHQLYFGVARTLLLHGGGDWTLPAVTFSPNIFGTIVNGSLWTLGPEFMCYMGVAALGVLGLLRPVTAIGLVILGMYLHNHPVIALLSHLEFTMVYFAAGAVMFFVYERGRPPNWTLLVAAIGLVIGALLGQPSLAFATFGAILVIGAGTAQRPRLPNATRFGDLSYGVYIFGWPVEAVVRHLLGGDKWVVLGVSTPIVFALAWLSWRLVEGPALRSAPLVTAALERAWGISRARVQGIERR